MRNFETQEAISSVVSSADIERITESTSIVSKWTMDLLKKWGVSDAWITYINMLFLLVILVMFVFLLHYITRKILREIFKRLKTLSQMKFFGRLHGRRFPHYLAMIVPFGLVKGSIPIIFQEFPTIITFANKLTDIYLIFYIIWLLISIINAFGDTLKDKEGLSDKPIDSYIQVLKIFFYFIGIIILFSILSGKDPMVFITGLGAASAILLLIFKDTILGFVASIEVSVNDIVKIGDWITMPKYNADGIVTQITLSTVKIKNYDNTIVTLPPYTLVSDSFQNWRGMQVSGGRRFTRSFYINPLDIHFYSDLELEDMKKISGLKKYIENRQEDLHARNQKINIDNSLQVNGYRITNNDLFMQYSFWILKNHPKISKSMTLMVRTLPPVDEGLPVQLYAFTNTTVWEEYETIVAEIMNQLFAAVKVFKLRIYSNSSVDPTDIILHTPSQEIGTLLQGEKSEPKEAQ